LNDTAVATRFAYVDALSAFGDEKERPKTVVDPAQSQTRMLNSHDLSDFVVTMNEAFTSLGDRDIILVLDSPDLILGTTDSGAEAVISAILKLRLRVHATIILLRADLFDSDGEFQNPTPMQIQQQQLLLSLAHQADTVFSVRKLDTGLAKDVTGVLRITTANKEVGDDDKILPAKEFLYHVHANRAVVVWERGSEQIGD
jgi:elongator complex protein 6